jgi:hypothetical protein
MCGMKVKPWASTEETLAALHATLVARHGCDIFWTSLRVLLETLARDLKTRQEAVPGTLVDNEVLDSERYATLIDEIRASLAQQTADPPTATFRRLASSLSTPALALLLLLGGAASVGCDQTTLHSTPDAATQNLADAAKTQPDTKADAVVFLLPDMTLDTKSLNAPTSNPDGAAVTIQDIMQSCDMSDDEQANVLACLSNLRNSWTTGMASALEGNYCPEVSRLLNCFVNKPTCTPPYASDEFAPGDLNICKPTIIYFGVRFV